MSSTAPATRKSQPAAPALRWWGGWVPGVAGGQPRFVLRWARLLTLAAIGVVAAWLAAVTALWGFYRFKREIPSVEWADVATARFARVQTAVGLYYFGQAKAAWETRQYAKAVMLARAAVRKAPADLEARLFLGGVWLQLRRGPEALTVLREGLAYHPREPRLHRAFVETGLVLGQYSEVLKWLREELPARGVRVLAEKGAEFPMAEVRAVFETAGADEAARLAAQYPALQEEPMAAPLLGRLDLELGRGEAGLRRATVARDQTPERPELHEAVVDLALRLGRADIARIAAESFLAKFPDAAGANLRFLETHDPAGVRDDRAWMTVALRFLVVNRRNPPALERLGDLAARRGWSDLAFLLYQNSLQETLGSRTYALHWVGSLVKRGDYVAAERVLQQLAESRDAAAAQHAPVVAYFSAMVEWGLGREGEAQRHLDRLRHEFAGDARRLQGVAQVFRTLGFAPLAERLMAAPAAAGS